MKRLGYRSAPDLGAALRWAHSAPRSFFAGKHGRSHWQKRLNMRWHKERFFGKLGMRSDREYRVIINRYRSRHDWYDQTFEQQEREWNDQLTESLRESVAKAVDGVFVSCEVPDE